MPNDSEGTGVVALLLEAICTENFRLLALFTGETSLDFQLRVLSVWRTVNAKRRGEKMLLKHVLAAGER